MSKLSISNHAVIRWQQRIDPSASFEAATLAIVGALSTAKAKHLKPQRLKKRTCFIPTAAAMLVVSRGVVKTILQRGQLPTDNYV